MGNLTITDLASSRDLDREAAKHIFGGINEWIHIPTPVRRMAPVQQVYNTYIDNDYTLIQPQFFNIGNGVANTGTIIYQVSPQFVSAVSPISVQS